MIISSSPPRQFVCLGALLLITLAPLMPAHDFGVSAVHYLDEKAQPSWPMFGGSPGRNMVNVRERNLPTDWCVQEGKLKNIKWTADLGELTFGSPVVASGKVFVATDNDKPRAGQVKGCKAVLMAFRETDGAFLWQNTHDYPAWLGFGGMGGLPSTPTVVGNWLYYDTPAGEVICADSDTGKINWRYNMIKELKVARCRPHCWLSEPGLSSPLVVGDLVFVVTGNGINVQEDKFESPKAPSFVALHRKTGKLVWQSNLPGANIIDGQWSSPTYANIKGRPQIIFAGGDCVIYSFAPKTGKLLWKCDCLPTRQKKKGEGRIDHYIVGTPVVVGDKLYVGLGVHPEHPRPPKSSYFLCLDITKKGDVSLKSYDAKAAVNKDSALVWAFGGLIVPPPEDLPGIYFGNTVSTAAVHDGLVYIPEVSGYLHCLDAATGRRLWQHDFVTGVLGSAYWVDGRLFVGTDDGQIVIFAHGRRRNVLATIDTGRLIRTTPTAANGVLYVATRSKLYAIGSR